MVRGQLTLSFVGTFRPFLRFVIVVGVNRCYWFWNGWFYRGRHTFPSWIASNGRWCLVVSVYQLSKNQLVFFSKFIKIIYVFDRFYWRFENISVGECPPQTWWMIEIIVWVANTQFTNADVLLARCLMTLPAIGFCYLCLIVHWGQPANKSNTIGIRSYAFCYFFFADLSIY